MSFYVSVGAAASLCLVACTGPGSRWHVVGAVGGTRDSNANALLPDGDAYAQWSEPDAHPTRPPGTLLGSGNGTGTGGCGGMGVIYSSGWSKTKHDGKIIHVKVSPSTVWAVDLWAGNPPLKFQDPLKA
jgi:hypothetical protein